MASVIFVIIMAGIYFAIKEGPAIYREMEFDREMKEQAQKNYDKLAKEYGWKK